MASIFPGYLGAAIGGDVGVTLGDIVGGADQMYSKLDRKVERIPDNEPFTVDDSFETVVADDSNPSVDS